MDPSSRSSQSVTIDVDEKSNDALSPKPSVKSYATKVFQESTVGILSSVFTTHSKYRRFFKVFLSSLCIAGFIYHCVTFLNHVLGYPEVVDISLDRSETYNWPAYTYCSNNPVRRSVFCKTYPKYCEMPSEYFCQKYFSYCGIYPNPIPKKKYYNILPHEITADWILKFGSIPNVLYLGYIRTSQKKHSYYEIDNISGPYLRSFGHARMLYSCYIIRSPIESSQQPLQKIRSKIEFVDENLRFFVNETEMMDPRSTPGVYFSVHSAFEVANPIKKGIFLKGGRRYELYVKMQEEVLLKAPFESDCMDYEEISEKNNGTGPRTKKMCQEKCYFDYSMLTHGCAVYSSLYPHKENICIKHIPTFEPTPSPVSEKGNFSLYKCFENCRDECRSLTYTTEIFENDQIGYVEDDEQYRRINLNIYLSNDGVKLIRHSPKYETVDVISSIGGFMGCWLGIALMDILDVFGSITTVCRYAFRKKLNKKIKRRQSM